MLRKVKKMIIVICNSKLGIKKFINKFFFWLLILKIIDYVGTSTKSLLSNEKLKFLNHKLDITTNYIGLVFGILLLICTILLILSVKNAYKCIIFMLLLEMIYYISMSIIFKSYSSLGHSFIDFLMLIWVLLFEFIFDIIIIIGLKDSSYDY